ncbi:MAG TPA: adenosine kinase [Rectinemataceae bacterium]|nr:adenosine kinase [Rectinemataceae bacterium]
MGTRIVAIGNALMDIFAFVGIDLPESLGYRTNGVSHLEAGSLDKLIARLDKQAAMAAGGGAANTVRAASLLGVECGFIGTVGDDEFGRRYRRDLENVGVKVLLSIHPLPTGVFCALIHPDHGRTILVAPGAAPLVSMSRCDFERRRGDILYIDGFALAGGRLLEEEGPKARAAGMLIAIDLGSKQLVQTHRQALLDSIREYCDFVFANEEEFLCLGGSSIEGTCQALSEFGCTFVVKKGERGAVFCREGLRVESPVRAQQPLDETGAGDAFAAGYLAAFSRGFAPELCLRLGNRLAEEAIAVPGLGLATDRIRQLRSSFGL